jgi:CBS domain-containing protein
MNARSFSELVMHTPPVLHIDDTIETAVRRVLDSDEPALPVINARERFAGIFGERAVYLSL